jgi:hypothetical protein
MPQYAGLRSIAQIVVRSQQACSFLVGTASSLSRRVMAPMLSACAVYRSKTWRTTSACVSMTS